MFYKQRQIFIFQRSQFCNLKSSIYTNMNLSTPKKKTNISNHIPMPLTYSLYRPSSIFKQQHELLTSISSPFIPSLRIQKKVGEFQRLSMTKIEKNHSDTKQHQKDEIQKKQFITQLLETPKKQSTNLIQINTKEISETSTLDLKPNVNKSDENKSSQTENQFILPKDLLLNQQSLSQQQQKKGRKFLPIQLGDCLKLEQQIPHQVTDIYLNFKKTQKSQPNFTQGYLKKIDCIYYAVENNLILHFPNGPRKNPVALSNKCIIVKLPDILYNIVETNLKMSIFQQLSKKSRKMVFKSSKKQNKQDQVLIMCHPYYIELYYLTLKQYMGFTDQNIKNPLLKLNIHFALPNCSKPRLFGISDGYLFYLPDKSSINLEYLCIETGQIKSIQAKCEKKYIQRKGYNSMKQKTKKQTETQNWKLSSFLLSKLSSCMMYTQPEGFIHKIGEKFCIDASLCKIICCEHNKKIACILELRTKNFIKKLFSESHLKQGINYQKLVRVYQKADVDPNNGQYNFEDIIIQDYSNQILNVQFINESKPDDYCFCKIKTETRNLSTQTIQQYTYTSLDKKYTRKLIRSIKLTEKGQYTPIIVQTNKNQTIIKNSTALIYLFNKCMFKCNPLSANNEYLQEYAYEANNIITVCTDTGYSRFVTINWLDLLYSSIYYYSHQLNHKSSEDIAQMASNLFELSLNSTNQNLCKQKYECIIKLLNGLLKLCSNENAQKMFLYQFKDNKIIIKSVESASDNIQKICISLFNYYSTNLNTLISQCMDQESISSMLSYIAQEQKESQANNKAIIFNYRKIQHYFNLKSQKQTNAQLQCKLQNQFNEITLKLFNQQKSLKYHIEPCALLSKILFKYSFMLQISQMLRPVWGQQLENISVQEVEDLLNKLDKISIIAHIIEQKLDFSLFQIYSPISHSKQEIILSPGSTLAHSNIQHQSHASQAEQRTNFNSASKSQPSIIQKIGQMLMLTEIIQKQCPNLLFGNILHEDKSFFSPYIFKKFAEDFDNQLFLQLEKAIPSFLNARDKQISYGSDYANYLPLKFWLLLFIDICGISNKIKIVKIVQQKLQSYHIVRLHEVLNKLHAKGKADKMTIVVPEYFLQYLDKYKDIKFIDLSLKNLQDIKMSDFLEKPYQKQEKKIKKLIKNQQKIDYNAQKMTQIQEKEQKIKRSSLKKRKEGIDLKEILSNKKKQQTK